MADEMITILHSHGRRMAKLICADGTIFGYDAAKTFDLFERPVNDLPQIAWWLNWLSDRSDYCVVRGAILDSARALGVRRLLHPDHESGDSPTLRAVARRWLALDFDHLPRPESVQPADLVACAAVAIERLPAAFRGVACVVQATASHGIKPGIRLRLWFWLDRAATGAELKIWLRLAPVDMSVFGGAQPIYTAAPIFIDGATSPIPVRLTMLPGEAAVRVPPPDTLAARAITAPLGASQAAASMVGGQSFAVLSRAAVRISRATEGTRHSTLLAEASSLARMVAGGCLSAEDVRTVLATVAEQIGTPPAEAQSIIDWALNRAPALTLGSIDQ
jgi:hypothetical protein